MMLRWALLFLLVVAGGALAEPPVFVTAIDDHFVDTPSPAAAPDRWLLAHVDVETTGLAPGWHEMIDIGVVLTDLDGVEIDRLFLRIMPTHPERTAPGAAAVNGFSEQRWTTLGAMSEADAVTRLVEFHDRLGDDRQILFVAYNAWFDIAFVDHLFRDQDRTWRELWHYFVLDVPSMAWGLGVRDLFSGEVADALDLRAETSDPLEHTGLTGALANVEKYRALVARLEQERGG